MSNTSQCNQILMSLQAGAVLSSLDGLRQFGTMRMAARIADLRNGNFDGVKYAIETIMEKRNGKRYALYRMKSVLMVSVVLPPATFKAAERAIRNHPTAQRVDKFDLDKFLKEAKHAGEILSKKADFIQPPLFP